ncbi:MULTISPECIES: hypothetical protein [Halorubrum]|uniref:hypothetical protein n=1 Tax=Halorubrum TaxID=56688 RepID=UPI0031F3044F
MAEDGRTHLRFDNIADHHTVDHHHCHTPDRVYEISSISVSNPMSGSSIPR